MREPLRWYVFGEEGSSGGYTMLIEETNLFEQISEEGHLVVCLEGAAKYNSFTWR